MPAVLSYPGVYIEEIPSGVRTIAGVATSITAFLGKALRGPADEPITITSFGGFERIFGGLHRDFTLSYAVRDFFVNRGSQAVIVRLYKKAESKASKALFEVPNLTLEAANEGAWGMKVRARVQKKEPADPNLVAVAQRLGVLPEDLFDLIVRDGGAGVIETFINLTTKESARRADRVLKAESTLVRVAGATTLPSATSPAKHSGALSDADVWTADTKSTPAKDTDPTDVAVDSDALDAAAYKGSVGGKTGLYQLEKVDLFNLLCILRHSMRKHTRPILRHQHVVFDTHADAQIFFRNLLVEAFRNAAGVGRDIEARLDRHDHACFCRARFAVEVITSRVVHVDAEIVTEVMHIKLHVFLFLDQFLWITF